MLYLLLLLEYSLHGFHCKKENFLLMVDRTARQRNVLTTTFRIHRFLPQDSPITEALEYVYGDCARRCGEGGRLRD